MQTRISRIAIIGISGSGKSTLARTLGRHLSLPVFHADAMEWLPNWVEQDPAVVVAMSRELDQKERWIIEGWVDGGKAERLNAADLILDLDYAGWLCAIRVARRMMVGQRRIELPEGCVDRWSWRFLWAVWTRAERWAIREALACATVKQMRRFTSPSELKRWLADMEPSPVQG